jgi:hypothetical protein
MTPYSSTSSLESYASDLDHATFTDINKRTLETHKWFKQHIEIAKKKAEEDNLAKAMAIRTAKNNDRISLVCFVLGFVIMSYLVCWHHILFVFRLCMLALWIIDSIYMFNLPIEVEPVTDAEIKLYMRFTRNSMFYQNTHYLFSGSKRDLEKVMNRLKNKAYNYLLENKDSRDDHDKLMDTPLDTFCSVHCHCNDAENNANYDCSHWELYNYASVNELDEDAEKIADLKTGMYNELIYI